MNEECIIRKLVADGDGGGDDRRFVTILTLLLKAIKGPEPSQNLLPRIMKMIDAAETAMKKQEIRNYQKELEELHEKQRNLEAKLADRRNHLHAFNIILANFCRFLKDEENDEIMNNDENLDGTAIETKKEKA
ncbi:hypothetical protein DINM_001053 [Dirofilaria immitis]|nr:hypothetical protein [Dirofilaria immitis]